MRRDASLRRQNLGLLQRDHGGRHRHVQLVSRHGERHDPLRLRDGPDSTATPVDFGELHARQRRFEFEESRASEDWPWTRWSAWPVWQTIPDPGNHRTHSHGFYASRVRASRTEKQGSELEGETACRSLSDATR